MLFGELGNSTFFQADSEDPATLPRCADCPESSLGALEKIRVWGGGKMSSGIDFFFLNRF